uniref:Sodium/bile acid cotransporter 7 (Trinotate prediction) n=1 Tax=Myxobolus squamalis TaxID=59785 RepID=A0A6B2G678_MYXSQ
MPPPVSAGIIVTDIYYGDEALAVTISAIGNILAAIISPCLILLIVSGSLGFSVAQSIQSAALIFFIFIVPILFGQSLRWCLPNSLLKRYKTTLSVLGKVLLLYLVYCGISLSLDSSGNSNVTLVMVGIIIFFICSIHGLACLFILACDYNYFISGSQKKRIALMFSSSMKSLSAGVTIILLLSEKDKEFLSYMLPLIMFEPLQITQSIFMGMYFRGSEVRMGII